MKPGFLYFFLFSTPFNQWVLVRLADGTLIEANHFLNANYPPVK